MDKEPRRRFFANKTDVNQKIMLGTLRERQEKLGHNGCK